MNGSLVHHVSAVITMPCFYAAQAILVVEVLSLCCVLAGQIVFFQVLNVWAENDLHSDSAFSFELVTRSECLCPGETVTFECSVIGRGSTVFLGSAFDCKNSRNEIRLLHNRYNRTTGTNGTCNNGAIMGHSLRFEDNHYISQLHITVSYDLVGTVECIHDNGTTTKTVGNYSIPLITTDGNGEDLNIHNIQDTVYAFIHLQ